MDAAVWTEIEKTLTQLLGLPHNQVWLRGRGRTVDAAVAEKLAQLRSGLTGTPRRECFSGPKLFLRVAGAANAAYAGEWWFDAEVLDALERAGARVFFDGRRRNEAIRDRLREVLAISDDFGNTLEQVWALELPPGERLVGYTGIGSPQRLFGSRPLSAAGNRMLVGRLRQIYFPVKNPFWVRHWRELA